MPSILLKGHSFNYEIERKSIVSIRLRLKSPESFVISCHHLTPNFVITKFINDHQDWISKNSQKITIKKTIKDIKTLQILGDSYDLIVKKMPRDSVVIFKEEHKIYANTTSLSISHLKKIIDHKFRPLALSLIKDELSRLSILYGFEYGHVSVRNTTSRFGSCSYRGNLNFNWQIILFPRVVFTHILLHELNHLKIKDHSKRFWDQLTIYDPNTKAHNLWLKKEGTKQFIV
jgi:predicted metal-dependent hydrolase